MGIEDLLAAAAKDAEAGNDRMLEDQEYRGLQLPPLRIPSAASFTLPPQLQRFALSPQEAVAHQRQSSSASSSSIDDSDLFGLSSGSKLSALAALSTMSNDGWPPNSYNSRQRSVSGRSMEPMSAPLFEPPRASPPQTRQTWHQNPPAPISLRNPPTTWTPTHSFPQENTSQSLPASSTSFPAFPSPGPSSAPPKTYDVAESIRESVEQLRRRQQALLTSGGEDLEAMNRFAPRSQRACVRHLPFAI